MKKPIVAILGRPNVGKSTLFNRIIGKREAIVDDQPGVTRDRKYAAAEWAGVEFELLDTGGYVPTTDDVFEKAIREQIKHAINEADVIIFLTDVMGISPLDEEISSILQRSGVPLILGVNKVDNESREQDVYDFYRLGVGEPHPISALSSRAIGDFLDAVVALLPKREQIEARDDHLRLAVVGRPNTGKSSFINAILGQDKLIVTEIAGTTRDAIDTQVRVSGRDIVLIDTAGLRRRSKVTEDVEYFSTVRSVNALQRCDVAVVMIDATEPLTDQDKKVLALAIDLGKGIVLAVNKWDLIEKDSMTARRSQIEMQEQMRDLAYIPVVFVSALTRQRIFKIIEMAIAVDEERRRTVTTAELNKFLAAAIAQHHPPAFGSKWVKINYVTQIKTKPPLFAFFTNEPKGIQKNYRYYLEKKLREQFGFLGVPIRMSFRKKNQ
ncbi:ribosome biogenesis GTPase Der [candidate division KSB1 bacterium]|nr:ribosome biogenesis GTPase Der [candidate division KSB1 bacterium]RQW08810.1 MAG: ribosome biogenesis GTPase Der [candidate division KSB1 bacterium]